MKQYRAAGLGFVRFAFVLGATLSFIFFCLLFVMRDDEDPTNPRQIVRLAIAIVLSAAAIFISVRPRKAEAHFVFFVSSCVLFSALAIGGMSLMPTDLVEPRSGRWAVAMCLTCWLAYGFSRLPVHLVFLSCSIGSVVILTSAAIYADEYLRALFIYLAMANLIGWILSVEIERRERALFWSARQLAEARSRSEAMAHRASEADAAKTRVMAAVSHDLRQPLASLTLYAQHLREHERESNNSGVRQALDGLEACIGAISSDLDRLSELGSRGSGAPFPVESIDLRNVLERIDRVYSGLAARAGIQLVVRVPAEGECCAVSNESRLWDIFANLVGNALKFAAPGRQAWVLVRVRSLGGGIEVVVRDNGIGIDAADQRRVFDEYFQVSNPSRSSKQGHGLGLSIVRETVSRLPGHSIRLFSRFICQGRDSDASVPPQQRHSAASMLRSSTRFPASRCRRWRDGESPMSAQAPIFPVRRLLRRKRSRAPLMARTRWFSSSRTTRTWARRCAEPSSDGASRSRAHRAGKTRSRWCR
ncbi:MAG TPA: HAMP domain-containing sensor histidine kinase, partial [Rhodocyclaceae bacterium]|nr:HAMP domain-containing sensor histidine kinase [Rhodocyclaceae bacterium]